MVWWRSALFGLFLYGLSGPDSVARRIASELRARYGSAKRLTMRGVD
jgi:hypothetical protein